MYSVLCIGHSHMDVALYAYQTGQSAGRFKDLVAAFLAVPRDNFLGQGETDADDLHPDFLRQIADSVASLSSPPDAVFLWIGGSYQHNLSLLNSEIPYDIVLPGDVQRPDIDCRQLIPHRMLEDQLILICEEKLTLLKALRRALDCPMFLFQAPPPNPSEQHISHYRQELFGQLIEKQGVSPLSLRRKVWKVHSNIYENICRDIGVAFLPAPPDRLDANGDLAPQAWGADPIHANVWYGEGLLLSMFEALTHLKSAETRPVQ